MVREYLDQLKILFSLIQFSFPFNIHWVRTPTSAYSIEGLFCENRQVCLSVLHSWIVVMVIIYLHFLIPSSHLIYYRLLSTNSFHFFQGFFQLRYASCIFPISQYPVKNKVPKRNIPPKPSTKHQIYMLVVITEFPEANFFPSSFSLSYFLSHHIVLYRSSFCNRNILSFGWAFWLRLFE